MEENFFGVIWRQGVGRKRKNRKVVKFFRLRPIPYTSKNRAWEKSTSWCHRRFSTRWTAVTGERRSSSFQHLSLRMCDHDKMVVHPALLELDLSSKELSMIKMPFGPYRYNRPSLISHLLLESLIEWWTTSFVTALGKVRPGRHFCGRKGRRGVVGARDRSPSAATRYASFYTNGCSKIPGTINPENLLSFFVSLLRSWREKEFFSQSVILKLSIQFGRYDTFPSICSSIAYLAHTQINSILETGSW